MKRSREGRAESEEERRRERLRGGSKQDEFKGGSAATLISTFSLRILSKRLVARQSTEKHEGTIVQREGNDDSFTTAIPEL